MAKQMDKVIAAFKNVVQNSSPCAGRILNASGGCVNISSTWSQRNIERKVIVRSEMMHVVNLDTKEVNSFTSTDLASELMTSYSPSNTYRGLFRDIPASGKTPKKQHLEVWRKNRLWKVYDLASYELHGDVYTDSEFGCFQWSPCETKILYIAEKKQPKAEPFLPKKHTEKPDDETKKGCEYEMQEDWGEALVGKCSPVLCVCDLQTDIVSVVSGIPEELSVGQGVWAPGGGIVAIAWPVNPRRLGLIYCTNRESFIFHISEDSVFRKLSSEGVAVRSPKFSLDGSQLVWLEREAGGPHNGCHRLVLYDWNSGQKSVLVDIVHEETKTSNGRSFYGIYNLELGRCWLSANNKIIFSTPQRASVKTYLVDIESREIEEVGGDEEESSSLSVLDATGKLILCARSSLDSSPALLLGRLSDDGGIDWTPLVVQEPLITDLKVGVLRLQAKTLPNPVSKFCALYMIPKNAANAPLIVWSHGGPHSSFTNSSSIIASFFASLGFGLVMVNYRGSTGAGQASIDLLPGHIGETDVADVQEAADAVLALFPDQLAKDKCLLFGGSHGGFLSLQLSAQYPSFYRSVAVRNPVTDVATIFSLSDIPDWGAVESGFSYSPTMLITEEMFEKMKSLSPLSRVGDVTAPTLLLLGKKDLRVPFYQGLAYYHHLKARGIKTRVLVYDDNHSLSQLPHEVDVVINSALWYLDTIDHVVD